MSAIVHRPHLDVSMGPPSRRTRQQIEALLPFIDRSHLLLVDAGRRAEHASPSVTVLREREARRIVRRCRWRRWLRPWRPSPASTITGVAAELGLSAGARAPKSPASPTGPWPARLAELEAAGDLASLCVVVAGAGASS